MYPDPSWNASPIFEELATLARTEATIDFAFQA
jgi:hypothetical protein